MHTMLHLVTFSFCLPAAPRAPTLAVVAKLKELKLKCSFGGDVIHCNVTMEINGMVMSASMNGTFYGLVSNTLYPISARAINRCGDYSETTNVSYWTRKYSTIPNAVSHNAIINSYQTYAIVG